ncbi:MAG TPA: MmgE/PrpD family protein [Trebonia sp.]|jgi:2-methylcitrate dehydratase PrpD
MTTTDEILALAGAAAGPGVAAPAGAEAVDQAAEVTEAELAAFGAAAARGATSDVVRALLAISPGPSPAPPATGLPTTGLPNTGPSRNPAWTAWLTGAAATAAAGEASENPKTAPVHHAWLAIFAAGLALSGPPERLPPGMTVRAAVDAGMSAAALVETGLDDWGGWSPGTVAATIGAGVTAGLLLGLTGPRLRAAIGICATQASGLAAAEGTQALALQVGKAAFNGVEAAMLAAAGLTAPAEPLDGRRGLFALFG